MSICFIAMIALQPVTAQTDMQAVIDHYKKLKNISYTIVRHRDPTDPKEVSADRIYWNDRRHFQIDFVPWGASITLTTPSLLCDDEIVDTLTEVGITHTDKLDPGPDHIGPWELRGGYLLCWLMGGKTWDQLTKPDDTYQVSYAYGPRSKWHDFDAKEILISRKAGGVTAEQQSVFIDITAHTMLGSEDVEGGQTMWTEIRDVHETEH